MEWVAFVAVAVGAYLLGSIPTGFLWAKARGIDIRTVNILEDAEIFTVQDLLERTPQQLMAVPNVGEKTLETIDAALERIGLYLPAISPRR